MFASMNRKRTRDPVEDVDSWFPGKKARSAGHEQGNSTTTTTSATLTSHNEPSAETFDMPSSGEDNSISSVISDASSSDTDTEMDMDTGSDFRMAFSQSPEQPPSSWVLQSNPLRNPRMSLDGHGTRVPTPIIHNPLRVQPGGGGLAQAAAVASSSRLTHNVERLPSPISEDEPRTPTAIAGSQLSLLTVTDVDMDMELPPLVAPPATPTPSAEAMTVRKQRQRSGAFTSPREPSKKLIMGYRDDCEKCRNRVPGHMNHFLGG
ncbi:hypothetical protein AAFC00_005976 [Neodothiora populina]|uniref:Uncharacterized protein n=1 Tax=Neodothiora populina TaxID=2781224 RepID=A0ABR3P7W2_9PEZI